MISKLITTLKDFVTPSDAALAGPIPPGEFVKGINFGGDAVTIEGFAWDSYSNARANGLSVPGAESLSTSVQPAPYANRDIRTMLNTVIYKSHTLEIAQRLPNGPYEIYLWIMENYTTHWHSLTVTLENQLVATDVGKLALGQWARYGPYAAHITDGTLHLAISTNDAKIDAHVMGMSIFKPGAS
jgi:hypothetical protein